MFAPDWNISRRPVPLRVGGRYLIASEIGAGGMASVHLGCTLGAAGFRRTVAIKRPHPHLAKDADFVAMFVDEARLAARIRHANVVASIDVASEDGLLFLVMEYVHGESLSKLLRASRACGDLVDPSIVSSVVTGALRGLHAAHEAHDERGTPLGLVHRDVSPQNIIVGADGISRVFDFGIAKAAGRLQTTHDGQMKGKFAYMPPEQLANEAIDRRADVYAASVVLWEMLTNRQLFRGDSAAALYREAMTAHVPLPSSLVPSVPRAVEEVAMRGLSRSADERFATARDMALALEAAMPPAHAARVGEWVERVAADSLATRKRAIAELESALAQEGGTPPAHDEPELPTNADVEPRTLAYVKASEPPAISAQDVGPALRLATGSAARTRARLRRAGTAAASASLFGLAIALWLRGSRIDSTPMPHRAEAGWTARLATPPAELAARAASPIEAAVPTPPHATQSEEPSASNRPPASRAPGRDESRAERTQIVLPRPFAGSNPAAQKVPVQGSPFVRTGDACNPPWTRDNEGIRHPKLECL